MHLVHQHMANTPSDESSAATGTSTTSGPGENKSAQHDTGPVARGDQGWKSEESPIDPCCGCCYELCAGLVDKPGKSLAAVAQEEVLEECGYDVPIESLRRVTAYQSNVATSGSRQVMFYATVRNAIVEKCLSLPIRNETL